LIRADKARSSRYHADMNPTSRTSISQSIQSRFALFLVANYLIYSPASPVFAQNTRMETPQNIVSLQAQGSVEVAQDWLTISMSATRDGMDAQAVQSQLKTALDAALAEAKKVAQDGQLNVRTGNFSLYPRYGRDGKINGWQGSTELVLEGRDFARISSTAGKINTLQLANVGFSLSREARAKVEAEATARAITRFKTKAQEISSAFGFASYTLREVNVNTQEQGGGPRPRMASMAAKGAEMDAAVPVEAGKSQVLVDVSGAVQMSK
jgi:predicted secreted protein